MKSFFKNIIYYIKVCWYFIEVCWVKLLLVFNIWKDISPILCGMYCYVIDKEKNEKEPIKDGSWIKNCKYYRYLKKQYAACTYLGFIGWDPCLGDQCKLCGEKYEDINE